MPRGKEITVSEMKDLGVPSYEYLTQPKGRKPHYRVYWYTRNNGIVSQKSLARARYVWVTTFGDIPEGMLVVHIDRDALNDEPYNLELMSPTEYGYYLNDEIHKRTLKIVEIEGVKSKYCPSCRAYLSVKMFCKRSMNKRVGLTTWCKVCANEETKKCYARNPEQRKKRSEYNKAWAKKNPEKIIKYNAKRRLKAQLKKNLISLDIT